MKNIKILRNALLLAGVLMLGTTACVYETIVPEVVEPVEDVSFSQDIIPIFNENCNLSGCHSTGEWAPDLTATNAYNSLINGNYVNTSDPESSVLYVKIAPGGSMEQYSSPQETALILGWIEEGAQNN